MEQNERLNEIIKQLHKNNCRVTDQRKILLQIILEHEYASCKEIFYEARRRDSSIGIATVYRTIRLLKNLGLIRKEMIIQI